MIEPFVAKWEQIFRKMGLYFIRKRGKMSTVLLCSGGVCKAISFSKQQVKRKQKWQKLKSE